MKTQGWVVVTPRGSTLWWLADRSRTGSQKHAELRWIKKVGGSMTWKELYRLGYRCVRCEVVK